MILYNKHRKNLKGMDRWWTISGINDYLHFICCDGNNITKHSAHKLSVEWSKDENSK